MRAGRSLRAAIVQQVLQLHVFFDGVDYLLVDPATGTTIEPAPEYSREPGAAARLRAALAEFVYTVSFADALWMDCHRREHSEKTSRRASADTIELALCVAALREVGVQQ
jgi:hypothetical protein